VDDELLIGEVVVIHPYINVAGVEMTAYWRLATISLLLIGLIWISPASAQDEEPGTEADTRKCISTRSIRRIRIIDDRNVLIYLSGTNVFHNVLRSSCTGLERVGTFSYNSSDGLLCEGDGISALQGQVWGDIRPVPHCWLGIHQRISKEQADAMREGKKEGGKIEVRPLPMPEPSEVGGDEEDPPT
jgi:hypothetical protein